MSRRPTPKAINHKTFGTLWRVQFRLTPTSNPTSERFTSKAAAERFIDRGLKIGWAAAREERNIGSKGAVNIPTLTEYAKEYIANRPNVTDRTRADYFSTARRSWEKRQIGGLPLDVITTDHVEAFVKEYQETGLSRKTIESARSLLAQVLQNAVERNIIARNPVKGVRTRKGTKRYMQFLTPGEFETLMMHCPLEGKPLIYFLFTTGARVGEATALQWKDVNLATEPATVTISKTWTKDANGKRIIGPPKTGKSNRTISLAPEMVALLGKRRDGDAFLFETFGQRAGTPIHRESFYKMVWKPLMDAANDPKASAEIGRQPLGKRIRLHDLRHSHASYLISQNLPMNVIQARLGHESVKTTSDTYGHLMPDALLLTAQASSASIQRDQEAPRIDADALNALVEAEVKRRLRALLGD